MIRVWLLFSLVCAGPAFATVAPNRETIVRAAFEAMPALLGYVEQLKSFEKHLPEARDRELFRRVGAIAAKGTVRLEFSDDRESFRLNPGEPERLMRSTAVQDLATGQNLDDGEILINRALLYEGPERLELAVLLKLLFHEFAHKTSELNWGVRDRLAQVFENQIGPHISEKMIDEHSELIVLSLPTSKIDKQIGKVEQNQPVPSNLLLLRLGEGYVDLTDNLNQRTGETTTLLRSMWTEANRMIFGIMREMSKVMTQALKPVFEGFLKPLMQTFGHDTAGMDEPFAKLEGVDIKEIRTLEIHEAKASSIENGVFVSMRATYTIGRTDKTQMPIEVNGFPWRDSFPVPVMVHILIPTGPGQNPESAQIDVQVRPNADYLTAARVLGVSRQSGVVAGLKVRFANEDTAEVERVHLVAHYGMGHLMLQASRIERLENGQLEASFDIPASFYPRQVALVADAVVVNGERTLFLDRLVTLSDDDARSEFVRRSELDNSFVDGSVGLWGLQDGKPTFRNHFHFRQPVWIIDNVKSDNFSLNHSGLKVEFQLRKEQKIREIRLYLNRSLILLDVSPDEKKEVRETVMVEMGGRTYRFANGGKMKGQKDLHDIATIDANEIYSAYLPTGYQKVQAVLSIPFRTAGGSESEQANEAHAPPMGYPFLLEVVTENLQMLRYYFQDPSAPFADGSDNCEDALKEIFRGAGAGDAGTGAAKASFRFGQSPR